MPRRVSVAAGYERVFDLDDRPIDAFQDFRERMDQYVGRVEHRRVPFLPWNGALLTSTGNELDFNLFPFQREWYEDEIVYRRFVCWMKCLAPETRVLGADLRWRRLGDVRVGDVLVGFDEYADDGSRKRRLRAAVVQARRERRGEAIRITMEDGSTLVASADHRFLWTRAYERSQRNPMWREVGTMREGDWIRRVSENPWPDGGYEDGWLGGILDGEGSLAAQKTSGGTALDIAQMPGDVLDRVTAYLSERHYTYKVRAPTESASAAHASMSRSSEIMRLLGVARPARFSDAWWDGCCLPISDAWSHIARIEPYGDHDLVDVQTSTSTFIAEGLASHNCTQVGVSEYGVRWSLFFPDKHGDKALYVFPALRQLRDFSDERVKPLVRSAYLRTRVPRDSVDNKMLKTVGTGAIYFRGSKNATDLDSIPASVLALDEYDDLVQGHIPRAEKRLSSPLSRGFIRRFGVPRYTELGIHAEYEKSDMREWHVRCRKCKTERPLHFYKQDGDTHHYVDTKRELRVCVKCETPLKRDWIAEGRWVARHPERDYIGYHVSRLIVPTAPISEIVAEAARTKPFEIQEFWNSTLGLPYDPVEGRLSKAALRAATRDYYVGAWDDGYDGGNLVTAGVDVASARNLNVRISEHLDQFTKRALFIGEIDSFDKLATMMDAYRVRVCLIDHLPDGRLGTAMVNRFPGRCFTVSWGDQQKEVLMIDTVEGVPTGRISARRTESISATLDMVRRQKNELPENVPPEYVRHMRAAVLKREEDEKGRVKVYYETATDHDYLQAEAYDLIGTEVWWALYLKGQAQRQTFRPLEEIMPFQRSDLGGIGGGGEYSPGIQSDQETWADEVAEMEGDENPDPFLEFRDW